MHNDVGLCLRRLACHSHVGNDGIETNPEDDSFHPWKEYDSLDDFLMQSIQD